jgi:hypothetical protein
MSAIRKKPNYRLIFPIILIVVFCSLPAHSGIGEQMYQQINPKPMDNDAYLFVWKIMNRSLSDLQTDHETITGYIQEIQEDFGGYSIFRRNTGELETMVQNDEELLNGKLTENEVSRFRENRIRYLLYGYIYQVPERIIDFYNSVPVIVLKIYDLESKKLVSVVIFDLYTRSPIEFHLAEPSGYDHEAPPILSYTCHKQNDRNMGQFLIDFFNYIQLSRRPAAKVEDGSLWRPDSGKFNESDLKDLVTEPHRAGVIKLLRFPQEEGVYLSIGGYSQSRGTAPLSLYRICGQDDIHLLHVVFSAGNRMLQRVQGEMNPYSRIRIQAPESEGWPYSRRHIKEIFGYYFTRLGMGIPDEKNPTHTLTIKICRLLNYSRSEQSLFPEYHYSLTLRRDSDSINIDAIEGTVPSITSTKLNTIESCMEFSEKRIKEYLRAGLYADAEQFIPHALNNASGDVSEHQLLQLNSNWHAMVCAARFKEDFEERYKEIQSLFCNNLIIDGHQQTQLLRNMIINGGCLKPDQRRKFLEKLESVSECIDY